MDDWEKGFADMMVKAGIAPTPTGVTIPLEEIGAMWSNGHGYPSHEDCGGKYYGTMMPLNPDTWICGTCKGTITDVDAKIAVERHRTKSEHQFKQRFGEKDGAAWAEVFLGVKK